MQMFTTPLALNHRMAMATQAEIEIPGIPATLKITPPGVQPASVPNPKKKLVRRTGHDYSQLTRRIFQIAFLVLNGWLGVIFYIWVRQFEPGGASTSMPRPAGVEGWLPIAGLMNLKYLLLTRHVPTLHPAALFLLIAFLAISFLFRKAFCSWLCPVGTISEYLWRIGRKFFRRNFQAPRWLDLALRSLKYLLLAFFFVAAFSMGADEISAFMASPYGLIADVRMLNFFRDLGETAAIVLTVLAIASLFIQNFWCRYLCPYGALLGLTALASPTRIRRNAKASCIDCAKCAKVCPSVAPSRQTHYHQVRGMHRLPRVRSRLSRQRHIEPLAPKTPRPRAAPSSCVGDGGRNHHSIFRNRRLCEDVRLLGFAGSPRHLPAVSPAG